MHLVELTRSFCSTEGLSIRIDSLAVAISILLQAFQVEKDIFDGRFLFRDQE